MKRRLRELFKKFIPAIKRKNISKESISPLAAQIDTNNLLTSKHMLRLGTNYGGWNIPADAKIDKSSICYCVGAGEDISFDCALASRFGCQVRIIDPTPRAIAHFKGLHDAVKSGNSYSINNSLDEFYNLSKDDLEHMKFINFGLSELSGNFKFFFPRDKAHVSCSIANLQKTEEYFIAECKRLSEIMLQERDEQIDLLKIDIEGAEYGVIRDILSAKIFPKYLLVEYDEVHSPMDEGASVRIGKSINLLKKSGFYCVYVEGSNATFCQAEM